MDPRSAEKKRAFGTKDRCTANILLRTGNFSRAPRP